MGVEDLFVHSILLIDDSPEVYPLVKNALGVNYKVTLAGTIAQGREVLSQALTQTPFDLILLDVSLPDGDGFGFCGELRGSETFKEIPVIFLTGKAQVSDKVTGFNLGADDYIVKPFDSLELKARIDGKLQRRSQVGANDFMQKGALKLQLSTARAAYFREGQEIDLKLTPTEFKLLYCFMRNEGKILTRDQLLNVVRADKVHVLDRTIDKHISSLRKKLAPYVKYIESVHGIGYRFSIVGEELIKKAAA